MRKKSRKNKPPPITKILNTLQASVENTDACKVEYEEALLLMLSGTTGVSIAFSSLEEEYFDAQDKEGRVLRKFLKQLATATEPITITTIKT